ncbi:MAG TPA: cytochrome c oxidase assembly protein, partial [Gemmatimonadota bacterium]
VASFAAGWALLFLALQGPLHDLSDTYLFSAHMVQHLVLTLVVPPLLLAGTPAGLLRPVLRVRAVAAAARVATRPLVAFGLYNALFALWHVPTLYDLMMRNHDVHVVVHLLFLASATLLWWPVAGPLPELNRLSPGAAILYLFLAGIPMMALASLISLADEVLYPWYAAAPRLWGLSPLEDQRLGGLIMWVPGSLVLWAAITIVFFRWSAARENEERPARAPGVRHSAARR